MLALAGRLRQNYTHGILVAGWAVTVGMADRQPSVLNDMDRFCDEALAENSIYALLHRERDRLFPDEMFADLFSARGRRSVPPSVVATVMVLQRLECLSDREAVERYSFDARWAYAAGVGSYDCGGGAVSRIRCWWISGPGWMRRGISGGSSIAAWRWPARRVW
jgi:hypothetical protein